MQNIKGLSCTDRRLLRAIEHVTGDLSRQSTLALLAKIAGLERTYFCRRFRDLTGLSFSEWNRRIRIEHAKKLLADTDLVITHVGMAVGYCDVTTFERNFRRCVQCSPRAFRLQQRQTSRTSNITIFADNSTTNAETPPRS